MVPAFKGHTRLRLSIGKTRALYSLDGQLIALDWPNNYELIGLASPDGDIYHMDPPLFGQHKTVKLVKTGHQWYQIRTEDGGVIKDLGATGPYDLFRRLKYHQTGRDRERKRSIATITPPRGSRRSAT